MTQQIQRSEPPYAQVAAYLRSQIQSGELQPGDTVPSARKLTQQWHISLATATKVLAALRSEGLVEAQPGIGTVVSQRATHLRYTRWQMTGRYARARAAQGLIFASDVTGDVRKDTIEREWIDAPAPVAELLQIAAGSRVFWRHSRTYVNDLPTEDTSMFFPAAVVDAAPKLETEERIQVVKFVEDAGFVVTRTVNEIRARHANPYEQDLFGIDANDIVIEHTHGAYGAEGEAVEAVINIRPAAGNIITFETYEAPING